MYKPKHKWIITFEGSLLPDEQAEPADIHIPFLSNSNSSGSKKLIELTNFSKRLSILFTLLIESEFPNSSSFFKNA